MKPLLLIVFFLFSPMLSAPYSKPEVTREEDSNLRPGDTVSLTCEAYGGYPQASVVWQDGRGHNLTENVTTSVVANKEGLYSVCSVLRVVVEPNSTYSCRLVNPLLGEEGHAFVTITGESFIGTSVDIALPQRLQFDINSFECAVFF